uniref:RNase H type-1 domain-containing protein n=1 Tax=Cannabis sativa TaxID=3483 RepID=A0A803NLK0_CANSA
MCVNNDNVADEGFLLVVDSKRRRTELGLLDGPNDGVEEIVSIQLEVDQKMEIWWVLVSRPTNHYESFILELPWAWNPSNLQFLKDLLIQKKPNFIFLCETLCKRDQMEMASLDFEGKREVFWRQRSKKLWLQDVDNNSKFFHALAYAQRRNNLISKLKDSAGRWVDWNSSLSKVGKNKNAILGFLKDKLRKRIQGWEGRMLSHPGIEVTYGKIFVEHRGRVGEMEETIMVGWAIWQARNEFIWQQKVRTAANIVASTRMCLDHYSYAQVRKGLSLSHLLDGNREIEYLTAPSFNQIKVNVDGALFEQEGHFGVGCVAQYCCGRMKLKSTPLWFPRQAVGQKGLQQHVRAPPWFDAGDDFWFGVRGHKTIICNSIWNIARQGSGPIDHLYPELHDLAILLGHSHPQKTLSFPSSRRMSSRNTDNIYPKLSRLSKFKELAISYWNCPLPSTNCLDAGVVGVSSWLATIASSTGSENFRRGLLALTPPLSTQQSGYFFLLSVSWFKRLAFLFVFVLVEIDINQDLQENMVGIIESMSITHAAETSAGGGQATTPAIIPQLWMILETVPKDEPINGECPLIKAKGKRKAKTPPTA